MACTPRDGGTFEELLRAASRQHANVCRRCTDAVTENMELRAFLLEKGYDFGDLVDLWKFDVPIEEASIGLPANCQLPLTPRVQASTTSDEATPTCVRISHASSASAPVATPPGQLVAQLNGQEADSPKWNNVEDYTYLAFMAMFFLTSTPIFLRFGTPLINFGPIYPRICR
jgi:hypothetical protein